jgi:hypothetical protein
MIEICESVSFGKRSAHAILDRNGEQVSTLYCVVAGLCFFGDTSWFIIFLKGLILAQNERWRRGLGMQVEREFNC